MPDAADSISPPPSDQPLAAREWLALVLCAATLLVFTYLTEPSVFGSVDWLRIHIFYKEYLVAAVRDGRLPLWNPYVALGRPFLADVDSVAFYPPNLGYFFLDPHIACALAIGLHLCLCLFGTIKLGRGLGVGRPASWAAALVFVSSAPIVGSFSSGLINYGAALCYLPLVLYVCLRLQAARSRRLLAALALGLGFQLLAGHPQAVWLTCFASVALLVGRRWARPFWPSFKALGRDLAGFTAAVVAAAGLAAVALLPLAELTAQSNRQVASLDFAGSYAMSLWSWMTAAVPSDPHMPVQANAQLYAGVVVLLLAPCAWFRFRERNVRALLLLLTGAGFLAAGNATPVFRLFYYVLPGLGHLRIPSRATALITLSLVLSAAISISPLRRRMSVVIPVGMVAWWVAYAYMRSITVHAGPAHAGCAASFYHQQSLLLLTAIALLWAWRARWMPPRASTVVASLLALLTAADLIIAGIKLRADNRISPKDVGAAMLAKAMRARGLFPAQGTPPRIAVPSLVFENSGMRYGWSSFDGYTSMTLGRVWDYIHTSVGLPVPTAQITAPEGPVLVQGPFPYPSMSLQVGVDPRTRQPVMRPDPDPRTYLVTAALPVADYHEAAVRMGQGHPFHRVALLERPVSPEIGPATTDRAVVGTADIVRFEPERVTVHCQSPVPAILVLAEPWYPGWHAQVNGRPVRCFPANAWMRAVVVPVGSSDVVFAYHSTYLGWAAVLSLATLAGLLASLRRKKGYPALPSAGRPKR
jgi:hypothetical protein